MIGKAEECGGKQYMGVVIDFFGKNHMTFMMLAGLTVILIANRKVKVEGMGYLIGLMIMAVLLAASQYLEDWCIAYHRSYRILYIRTTLVYWIFPLISLYVLYMTVPIRRKWLLFLPHGVNMVLAFLDLFDLKILYYYTEDYQFQPGALKLLPLALVIFYAFLSAAYAVILYFHGDKIRSFIISYMMLMVYLTIILDIYHVVANFGDEIVALELLVYYCYMAAIYHARVREKLHEREMELEQNKLTLLMAQIRPHFINNALISIQELCYEEPERVAGLIGHFSMYLRNSIEATEVGKMFPLEKEIDAVKEYLALEYADREKKFVVEYELEVTDFMVPALSIEPLVENAVKHGIDRYDAEARVIIASYEKEDDYYIEIRDNGKGFELNEETLGKGGIGLKNSASRLKLMCSGEIKIELRSGWTIAEIRIPKQGGGDADAYDNDR